MDIMLTSIKVPPELIKGRGIPVTGIKPMVIPMFSKMWNKIMPVMPVTIREPNMLAAFFEINMSLYNQTA